MAKGKKWFWKRRRSRRKTKWSRVRKWLLVSGLCFIFGFPLYVVYLDVVIRNQFEGKKWALPARVFARPLEVYSGLKLSSKQFELELGLLGYRPSAKLRPGNYLRRGNSYQVVTRPFQFWDGKENSVYFQVNFVNDKVGEIRHGISGAPLPIVRFDPVMIGSIYPSHNEDRILVRLDKDIPKLLVSALIHVEDRSYYSHHGVDPKGIARAMMANLRAGRFVQGGSTLTQQLVKNYFLTNERSLWRKFREAIMSILLEIHYDKDEILQAYCNEIYLGQDGGRAIHGFGLASWFYFQRPLKELKASEISLLVGLVKGPSYYDPRRRPHRVRQRRDLVIDTLFKIGELDEPDRDEAKAAPLGVTSNSLSNVSNYPAFLDLVRRQLRRDYREEDLNSEGLRIFTTMNPIVQANAEASLKGTLSSLETRYSIEQDSLEGAVVVSTIDGGELLAVVGGRRPRYAGFNRALDAVRPVGSLMKPAVFLTALEDPKRFTLSSLLDDSELTITMRGDRTWTPLNYDQEFHGMVPLQTALVKSYNVATARLGMQVGVEKVVESLRRLGIERHLNPYPSLLLGATALSPVEITQMYQTIASGGFRAPLRAIREVMSAKGSLLQSYPLSVERVFDPKPIYLITKAMQEVVRAGTGQSLNYIVPGQINIAGKTGTTDELRDSWFAGFTGNYVATVWVGRDDNQPARLTGASGALKIWGNIMAKSNPEVLRVNMPEGVDEVWIDPNSNLLATAECADAVRIPFIMGSEPQEKSPCTGGLRGWMKRNF